MSKVMINVKLLKKFLLPGVISLAATPIAVKPREQKESKTLLRPSELPIYNDEPLVVNVVEEEDEDNSLLELVGSVRREVSSFMTDVSGFSKKASSVVQENWEASNEILDYLKEEENVLPRSGAIALGGLTGLVFGLRGGFFKRLIYLSAGAGGMAALCYPREAEEYFEEGMVIGHKYALIGHHLATSVLEDLLGSSQGAPGSVSTKEDSNSKDC